MIRLIYCLFIASSIMLNANTTNAQAWNKKSTILSLGIGVSNFAHINDAAYLNIHHSNDNYGWYNPMTAQFNLQLEIAVSKYLGLGITTGIGARARNDVRRYPSEINVPFGMIANFHFYQLISDKTRKKIHSDKLDIYAGANLGTGIATTRYYGSTETVPLAFAGVHAGIRYYVTQKFGLNAELGFGKSIVNAGLSFRL